MRFPRSRYYVFLTLLVLLADRSVCAQWKNLAPGLLDPLYRQSNYDYGGASCFSSGVIWTGKQSLWSSSDTGKTWTKNGLQPGGIIMNIAFYDRFNGIVATDNGYLFLTRDGGNSWSDINTTGSRSYIYSSFFLGSPQTILFSPYSQYLYISRDGGMSWTSSDLGPNMTLWSGAGISGGSAYALLEGQSSLPLLGGTMVKTTDFGNSWQSQGASVDWDSYSFDFDKCDSNILYITNEDAMQSLDGNSNIFVSTNHGNSWVTAVSGKTDPGRVLPYITGSIRAVPGAVFAQTRTDGILRSTDKGKSWKSIQGPNMSYDTRYIAAINCNIIFAVDSGGSIWATFNSGGDSITFIPGNSALSLTPGTLFDQDTIRCFDSIRRSIVVHYSGCNPPSLLSWSVEGKDSLNYHLLNFRNDSLSISYAPKSLGKHSALLIVIISDSSRDTIALKGYNDSKPFSYSYVPQSLFGNDSMYICSPQKTEKIILQTAGCPPTILSQNIVGKDRKDYEIIREDGSPIITLDSVIISFDPSDSGARNASYELTFDNGSTITIPLLGYGIAPHPLALTTADRSTDTIGGSVNIPITISGLDHIEDIDLVVHYASELRYYGSYSLTNSQLDLPSEGWYGRSKLHIPQAQPNIILGYARFDVFNDSLKSSQVIFDSVTVLTAAAPCQYILPASVMSIITPPSGCGIQTLSRFMHNGTLPQLSIVPNPTSGEISITSTGDLGEVCVTAYDMLGVQRGTTLLPIGMNMPAKFALPVNNGVYDLRLQTVRGTYDLRVIVNR